MSPVKIGIIGGGLMGREMASAFARWCALTDVSVRPVLTAVADLNPATLSWFDCIPSCTQKTTDYKELLANPGCHLQIARGLRQAGSPISLLQPVTLLARAYRAESKTKDGR